MKLFFTFLITVLSINWSEAAQIDFYNKCGYDIWVSPLANDQVTPLQEGIAQIGDGGSFTYQIPDGGWAGLFWPKTGCDGSGQNCQVGQSVDPCGANGCEPPANTKVEFFFPPSGDSNTVWYDISLVDGYSLPVQIDPSVQQDSCISTNCAVSLDSCPSNENEVGDLRVVQNGQTVQCLSPCKRWNYPAPYGMGNPDSQDPGAHLCCPTPPITSDDCRAGPVVQTQYVGLIHNNCPTAYAYAYDDMAGLHNCPNGVSFSVTFCP